MSRLTQQPFLDGMSDDVTDWVAWNGTQIGWRRGNRTPQTRLRPDASERVIARYRGPGIAGQTVLAESLIDHPAADEWELWVAGVDSNGVRTGYFEQLAWCRWPTGRIEDVAPFLIQLQRVAFQSNRTEFELLADEVLNEGLPGTARLLLRDDEDAEE